MTKLRWGVCGICKWTYPWGRSSVVQNSVSWGSSGWTYRYRHQWLMANHEDRGVYELTASKAIWGMGAGALASTGPLLHLHGSEDGRRLPVQKSVLISVRTPPSTFVGLWVCFFWEVVSNKKGWCLVQPFSGSWCVRKKLYHFSWGGRTEGERIVPEGGVPGCERDSSVWFSVDLADPIMSIALSFPLLFWTSHNCNLCFMVSFSPFHLHLSL